MRPRDLLNNGEAHSGARNMPGLRASIEAFEDPPSLALWNGRTGIANDDLCRSVAPRIDLDGRRAEYFRVIKLSARQSEQLAIGVDSKVFGTCLRSW